MLMWQDITLINYERNELSAFMLVLEKVSPTTRRNCHLSGGMRNVGDGKSEAKISAGTTVAGSPLASRLHDIHCNSLDNSIGTLTNSSFMTMGSSWACLPCLLEYPFFSIILLLCIYLPSRLLGTFQRF